MALPRRAPKFIDSQAIDDRFSVRSEGLLLLEFKDDVRWARKILIVRLRAACERRREEPEPVIAAVLEYLDERGLKIPVRVLADVVGISDKKAGRILREAWPERNMGE